MPERFWVQLGPIGSSQVRVWVQFGAQIGFYWAIFGCSQPISKIPTLMSQLGLTTLGRAYLGPSGPVWVWPGPAGTPFGSNLDPKLDPNGLSLFIANQFQKFQL